MTYTSAVPRQAAKKSETSTRRRSALPKVAKPVRAIHAVPSSEGDASESSTRYQSVANALKVEIAGGAYAVGAKLPTEFELCRRFDVSRSTIRQALAQLEVAGVVKRRQGSGTTVLAREPALRYSLSVTSEADILRFASETLLEFTESGMAVSSADSRRLHLGAPGDWRVWRGLRRSTDGGPPLGLAAVYVAASFNESMKSLGKRTQRPIFDYLAETHNFVITSIEQEITATVIDESEGEILGVATGTPALAVLRRFIGENRVVEVSETIFPADRFSYEFRLERDDYARLSF